MPMPFTIEDIQAAYRETGLRPITGEWAISVTDYEDTEFRCGCGLSALVASRFGFKKARAISSVRAKGRSSEQHVARLLGMTLDQVNSFMLGFDHGEPLEGEAKDKEAYRLGRKARRKVRAVTYHEFFSNVY